MLEFVCLLLFSFSGGLLFIGWIVLNELFLISSLSIISLFGNVAFTGFIGCMVLVRRDGEDVVGKEEEEAEVDAEDETDSEADADEEDDNETENELLRICGVASSCICLFS